MSKILTILPLLLTCVFGFLLAGDDPHCTIANAPDWIQMVTYEVPEEGSNPQDANVLYLLLNVQVDLDRGETYTHIAKLLATAEGVQQHSMIELEFDPSYETIVLHQLRIHRNGSCIDKTATSHSEVIQPEREINDYQYTGRKEWVILLDDIQRGDVIEYNYSRIGQNPAFKGMYNGEFLLQTVYPLKHALYQIVSAQNRTLHFKSHGNHLTPKLARLVDGKQEWSWEVVNVAPFQGDSSRPSWHVAFPLLQVSEFSNWSALAQWGSEAFALPSEYSAEMQQMVNQWKEQTDDDEARVILALRFVQKEIRYLGIEMGSNTHEPETPNLVLQRRYGDCKDKVLLLKALLDQMGIASDPVLVSSWLKDRLNEWHPAINLFDHVILQIAYDGRFYWVDPTLSNQECPLLGHNSCAHYGKGLVLNSKTTDLEVMPEKPFSKVIVKTKFEIGPPDQPAIFEKKVTYFGKEAERLRGIYRQFSQQEIEKFYDDAVGERFGPFEKITSIQIHDDVTKNAFSLKSGYRLHEFWKENEEEQHDYFTVFPQYLMDSLDFAINPSREAPLALDHPVHIVEYTTIIDTESDWDQEPLKKKLESDDLAFHYTKKSEGNTLTLRYEFQTKQDHVPVERLGEHRKHMQSIEDLLFTTITFSRGNSDEIWAELFANDNYILLGSLTICYAWVIYMLVRKTKKEGNKS